MSVVKKSDQSSKDLGILSSLTDISLLLQKRFYSYQKSLIHQKLTKANVKYIKEFQRELEYCHILLKKNTHPHKAKSLR